MMERSLIFRQVLSWCYFLQLDYFSLFVVVKPSSELSAQLVGVMFYSTVDGIFLLVIRDCRSFVA